MSDEPPTHEELRHILSCLDEEGKALVLFLASTGSRVGEALRLKVDDLELDDDPPQAWIEPGMGTGRLVGMTYEARDALRDWLKIKPGKKKPGDKGYSEDKVFDITSRTAHRMWSKALAEAGLKKEYRLHSLRRFFRSNIARSLDLNLVDSLMGHKGYLDSAYRRMRHEDIMAEYKKAMGNLSLFTGDKEDLEEEDTDQA